MRVWQGFAFGAIMHHEKPPAYSLFRRMHGIARDSLLNLRQQRLRIADEEIAHVFAAFEFRLQQFYRAANNATLQLHKTSIKRDPAVRGCEQAEGSFAPNVCGFDCRAVLQNSQQRKDSTLREIPPLPSPLAPRRPRPNLHPSSGLARIGAANPIEQRADRSFTPMRASWVCSKPTAAAASVQPLQA